MPKGKCIIAMLIAIALTVSVSQDAGAKENVIIFHAGSLSVPLAEMEKVFETNHPNIDILRESGGSTKMARMISEQGKTADIMASADFAVIDKTLIPNKADWNIRFATNQMVLSYTDKSRFANEINAENWYEILARKEVVWGAFGSESGSLRLSESYGSAIGRKVLQQTRSV